MTQIILLGDSLVADYEWQRRMNLLKVQNFGVPGATANDLMGMLPYIKKHTAVVDIILVMVGTNDLLSDNYRFIDTIKKIIIQLRKNYPLSDILVNSLFPMDLPHLPNNTISSFNTLIEAIATQTGSCFLDTHTIFLNSNAAIFQADGVHITGAAYEIWAKTLLEHIAFLVEND